MGRRERAARRRRSGWAGPGCGRSAGACAGTARRSPSTARAEHSPAAAALQAPAARAARAGARTRVRPAQQEGVVGGEVAERGAALGVRHQHQRRAAAGGGPQLQEARERGLGAVEEREARADAQALLHLRGAGRWRGGVAGGEGRSGDVRQGWKRREEGGGDVRRQPSGEAVQAACRGRGGAAEAATAALARQQSFWVKELRVPHGGPGAFGQLRCGPHPRQACVRAGARASGRRAGRQAGPAGSRPSTPRGPPRRRAGGRAKSFHRRGARSPSRCRARPAAGR